MKNKCFTFIITTPQNNFNKKIGLGTYDNNYVAVSLIFYLSTRLQARNTIADSFPIHCLSKDIFFNKRIIPFVVSFLPPLPLKTTTLNFMLNKSMSIIPFLNLE
ncbi:hypothetical protein JYU34_005378 [Plutella xylostella]|uniref:Uncharacterized protein n=1 Tax=Plutella xylostella TaxID=51655 RepID=A0ABQ7QWL3_PLUXY|nr:hypothetical protein JYU34_005378 [Plutella xylostella]